MPNRKPSPKAEMIARMLWDFAGAEDRRDLTWERAPESDHEKRSCRKWALRILLALKASTQQ